ncbi:MAG TPA: hypothetical protein VHC71_06425 [Hyphomicrobium sp.]|nr:hypothetical protein [Hyphomicrobium sp.]
MRSLREDTKKELLLVNLRPDQKKRPEKNKPLLATPVKRCSYVLKPPQKNERQKTVMVLGVERGGTSMAAGILRGLGVNMGNRVGFNHEDPQFLTDDPPVLQKRIQTRNKEADVWGFKIPKHVQLMDFFEKNLRNPYYVIVFRNLLAIADSWQQRGAGSVVDSIDRTIRYYNLIVDHCKKTNRPVLMLNYERVVSGEEGKEEAVLALGDFLGVNVDAATLDRAVGMITGDGKGYVNLPEHFFAVTATQKMPERPPLNLQLQTPDLPGRDGWIEFDTLAKKLTFARPGEAPLPPTFWLRLDLDVDPHVDLSVCPLRVYFNYTGTFYPAHCARPPVRRGINYFLVETSGLAKALAFGPLQLPMRMRIRAETFAAFGEDEDVSVHGVIADSVTRPDAAALASGAA